MRRLPSEPEQQAAPPNERSVPLFSSEAAIFYSLDVTFGTPAAEHGHPPFRRRSPRSENESAVYESRTSALFRGWGRLAIVDTAPCNTALALRSQFALHIRHSAATGLIRICRELLLTQVYQRRAVRSAKRPDIIVKCNNPTALCRCRPTTERRSELSCSLAYNASAEVGAGCNDERA
ncbi:hypothetical protein EVAR_8433_1 [Eumeta japonica]|uniref:Uncharacterized protein n=1 Tax=Eumeta variegata TaxID=151549 RepID=A0A4C1WFC5_EUMVA|nr:hypothetical protein EVAR_8433_1 [Eumeta japonica]